MQGIKSILVFTVLALLGYMLYEAAMRHTADFPKSFTIRADGTAVVIGTIAVNDDRCVSPGTAPECVLKIRTSKNEDIYVIYDLNDNSFCANELAANAGRNLNVNSQIQAYGYYKKINGKFTLNTCPSENYALRALTIQR